MKKLTLLFIGLHLLVILLINCYGTWDSYNNYYKGAEYEAGQVYKQVEEICFSPAVWSYASYTGTSTSYGFYAPNVASQFLMSFSVYDSNGVLIDTRMTPKFQHRESVHRFGLCTSLMQDKLGQQGKNELLNDYIEVMLHQIAMHIKEDYPGAETITTNMYLHEYPTVEEALAGKPEGLTMVDFYSF